MAVEPLVVVIGAEPARSAQIRCLVENAGCRALSLSSFSEAAWRARQAPPPDLVLLSMHGVDGLDALKEIRQAHRATRVVMLARGADPRLVVRAVHGGADDCIESTDDDAVLSLAREQANLTAARAAIAQDDLGPGGAFVAVSAVMKKLRKLILEVAPTEVPVLCVGESGTGKEVLARMLHKHSGRRAHQFLKVNCAALPGELLESELFGYEPGAFTGAVRPKPGKFELCNRGTILLDEIGEMPPPLQAKLLHVLQDGAFTRLGGRVRIQTDVRVAAATNVDIREALETKRLREDLYYRLNTVVLEVPPLRERREDIPILLEHFLEAHGGRNGLPARSLSAAALRHAVSHHWPGNVRELENFAKRFLMLGDQALSSAGATGRPRVSAAAAGALKPSGSTAKRAAETTAIQTALRQTNWNRKEAARLLDISYRTLLDKLKLYEIAG